MTPTILGLLGIGGGAVSTWLVRWIAGKVLGKFGSSVLGRIGDAIERRRGKTEGRRDGKQA